MIDARRNFSNLFACNNIFQEKFQNLFVNFYPYLGKKLSLLFESFLLFE